MASEEESKKAHQAQREAEAERRLAEKERQERTSECLSWRERHQELADRFRAQEELTALRQNKAVRKKHHLCRRSKKFPYHHLFAVWSAIMEISSTFFQGGVSKCNSGSVVE